MTDNNLRTLHWSDDDLLDRLYGQDAPAGKDASHLDQCEACGQRWNQLTQRKAQWSAAMPLVDEARLRAQRERIWRRVEETRRPWIWRAVPAAATALMLLVGVALQTGSAPEIAGQKMAMTQPVKAEVSDQELFSEIASIANDEEPAGAAAIRNLFDANGEGEAQ
jgi:anti-sigma factor RsiW